jgi:adenylyltransferase/sulfurtransferase
MVPSCNEAGVLGALAGVVGTLQAMETLKLILGIGEPLVGRMLVYDALAPAFRTLKLPRDPACPLCGARPSITDLVDDDRGCSAGAGGEISVVELRRLMECGEAPRIIDVRTPGEYQQARLPHSELAPLQLFDQVLPTLSPDEPYLVFCHRGQRSAYACDLLREAGFTTVRNITGGLVAWQAEHGSDLLESGPLAPV